MFSRQTRTRGRQTALVNELIGGQKVVKAFGHEAEASRQFSEINEELRHYSQRAVFFSSLTNPSTRAVNNVIYALVALAGAFRILSGHLTVGGLTVLLSYANQYMKPFNDISSVITELQSALACAARIFELIEAEPESPDAEALLMPRGGQVDIREVSFSYDKTRPLIEGFSFSAAPGTKTAIVGPTGCGKTTFINLLMRFPRLPPPLLGHGAPGHLAQARHRPGEHRLRQARRHGRGDHSGRKGSAFLGVHPPHAPAPGYRDHG